MAVRNLPMGIDPTTGTLVPTSFHIDGIGLGRASPATTDPDPASVAVGVMSRDPHIVWAGLAVAAFLFDDDHRPRRRFAHHDGRRWPQAEAKVDVDSRVRVRGEGEGPGQQGHGKQV
jgi:hypothetical protein